MAAFGKITMSQATAVYSGTAVVCQPSHRRRRSTSDARTHMDTHTHTLLVLLEAMGLSEDASGKRCGVNGKGKDHKHGRETRECREQGLDTPS